MILDRTLRKYEDTSHLKRSGRSHEDHRAEKPMRRFKGNSKPSIAPNMKGAL